jgi:hypothetical protein
MDAEQFINALLDRCERNGRSADKAWKKYTDARDKAAFLERTLMTAQEGNRRYLRDIAAAEAKIAEWAEYASLLRSAIDVIDPKALKRKTIVFPTMPGPFETEIPF